MRSYTIIVSIIAALASACAISCAPQGEKQTQATTDKMVNHIEVIYFHGNMRCITCRAIEKLADGHESRKDLTQYGFRTARRHHEMFQDSLASAIRQSLENLKP